MEADFGGWVTKSGLKCTDGRTIMPDAFKHMDKVTVPLVWQHGHDKPDNVLGHVILEHRNGGVYGHGFFNNTKQGENAKTLVQHKDIDRLSIYANQLVEKSKQVFHGFIREVSLVLSGANPGALIDYVAIQHGDGSITEMEDEAIIYTGLSLEHAAGSSPSDKESPAEDANEGDFTVQDVYDSMTDEQKDVLHYMIGQALAGQSGNAAHSNDESGLTHQEGTDNMTRNVFEQNGRKPDAPQHVLSHEDVKGIMASAIKQGSLKHAVEDYALQHGVDNIDTLFPNYRNVTDTPEFIQRRTEWVAGVLNGVRHSPFSRVRSITADITMDEARAKGYIKGNMKKEEFFSVSKRTTSPTTVYKKQKLDRNDIVDITDFDVVLWMKAEMRLMLEEELARAILFGDGRDVADADKIKEPSASGDGEGIRSIMNDNELYVTTVQVNIDDASSSYNEVVESILKARRFYKGTGQPTLYTTNPILVNMLLTKDGYGRRLWNSKAELAASLMVADIVEVEAMEPLSHLNGGSLMGIMVNLADYNIGADKGGEINLFDFFDIDFNQYKYLIETRVSGALVKPKSALVINAVGATLVLIDPVSAPTYNNSTYVVTIPSQANVVYKNADTGATLAAGAQPALTVGQRLNVQATPAAGYYFATNAQDQWTFFRRS